MRAPKNINGTSSLMLDALRLAAAMTVFLVHARAIYGSKEREYDLLPSRLSHGAVVVFFILSGYVIAYTTSIKKRGAVDYAVARLSRLYSVFFPAILFTSLVSWAVCHADSVLYAQYDREHSLLRYLVSSVFCNEIWFFSAAPLINGPIWSLSYEFWFYTLFGCWLFRSNGWKGWGLVLIVAACAGPKILLMLPIWLLGCLAYFLPRPAISARISWTMIALLLLLAPFLMVFLPSWPFRVDEPPLFWAGQFITDAIVGCCIAMAFYLLPAGSRPEKETRGIIIFRSVADLTFPIYVLHFPCLVACKAFIRTGDRTKEIWLGILVTSIFCAAAGYYLEMKRPVWQACFSRLWSRLSHADKNLSNFRRKETA